MNLATGHAQALTKRLGWPHNDIRLGISVEAYRFNEIRNWSYSVPTANGYESVGVLTIVSLRELSVAPPAVNARGAHLGRHSL